MHNLLMGTGSRLVKHYVEAGILNDEKLEQIQNEINATKLPSSIGRIPSKIKGGFKNFTADEWKHFILHYSLPTFKGRLDEGVEEENFKCWAMFVKACLTLCARSLRIPDVHAAHATLMAFSRRCEILYSCSICTINMHLHYHLKSSILDYGALHNFWCFSFERMNGILGLFKTNNHAITITIMRKIVQARQLINLSKSVKSKQCYKEYSNLLVPQHQSYRGSLRQVVSKDTTKASSMKMWCADLSTQDFSADNGTTEPVYSHHTDICLNDIDLQAIKNIYKLMYPNRNIRVVRLAMEMKRLVRNDEHFRSDLFFRENKSSCIEAIWISDDVSDVPSIDTASSVRLGKVESFILSEAIINDSPSNLEAENYRKKVYFAKVKWFKIHPHRKYIVQAPVQIWCKMFEADSDASFIPVERIISPCAILEKKIKFPDGLRETVLISSPVYQNMPLW